MKKKSKVWMIFLYLFIMILLTMCSQVLSEQSKPVVLVEKTDLRAVIPKNYLHEIRDDEKKAIFYVVEDTKRKRNRYVIKEQEVVLREKNDTGYLIGGLMDYSAQWVVSYASGRIGNGTTVSVVSQDELFKEGTLVFFNVQGKKPLKKEFSINGIVQEEEKRLRQELTMDKDIWKSHFFGEEKEELPQKIILWGWQCVLFFLGFFGMIEGFRMFGNGITKRLKKKYWTDFGEEDIVFLLENAIWIMLGFFVLYFLAQEIGQMDYSFLRNWLPEERVFDFTHYRQIYQEWKNEIAMYCTSFPGDLYAELLLQEQKSWRKVSFHFQIMAVILLLFPFLYTLFRQKRGNT